METNYEALEIIQKFLWSGENEIGNALTEYPELRYDVDNGLTLCKKCHNKYTFIPKTKNADRRNEK